MITYARKKEIAKNELMFPIVVMSSADVEPVRIGKQTIQRKKMLGQIKTLLKWLHRLIIYLVCTSQISIFRPTIDLHSPLQPVFSSISVVMSNNGIIFCNIVYSPELKEKPKREQMFRVFLISPLVKFFPKQCIVRRNLWSTNCRHEKSRV